MRILVVPNGFPSANKPYNGIFVLRQLRALMARGHDVRVLRILPITAAKPDGRSGAYMFDGVRVETVRRIFLPRLRGLGVLRIITARDIEQHARAFRADLIHAHAILFSGYLSFGRSVPMVLTSHGSDAYAMPNSRADLNRAARRTVSEAQTVVGVSDFIRMRLAELGRNNAGVVFNGADEATFYSRSREGARLELNLPLDRFIIAFIGNLLVAKGIFELANACAQLRDLRPLLLIAGEGPQDSRLRASLEMLHVDYRAFGTITQDRVALLIGAANTVVLPSYQEGLPCIVCETMLSGRAIVATPVGGIPEIVTNGRTGWLVPVKDTQALAQALKKVHDYPDFTATLEREARDLALKRLTWRINAAAYERIYEETMAAAKS